MAGPDPYRDELRAAQARIALLEDKLAARDGADDEEDDQELSRLRAQRKELLRSAKPRVRAERSAVVGMVMTAVVSLVSMVVLAKLPHPNLARAAVGSLLTGAISAALVFWVSISSTQVGLLAVDKQIAAARRRLQEARRLRAIEEELRASREAREAQGKAPRVRVDVAERAAEDEEEEVVEEKRARRSVR